MTEFISWSGRDCGIGSLGHAALDRDLKVGDEVRITVGEESKVDLPCSRERRDRAKELRSQKRYVREMAKRFGWKIQTKP